MAFAERNWAGNVAYDAARFHEPASVEEVQAVVVAATKVRGVGSRHSFNTIADTDGDQVSLAAMTRVIEIDAERRTVAIDGGVRYGELATFLNAHGYALANLASLPHISVAGACATATHGSGVANGNLATAVRGLQLVTAEGHVVEVSRDHDPELIDAMTVGLGAFGIVTGLTLAIEPTFSVEQTVFEHVPLATALDRFHEIMADGYSVSLFTTWRHDEIEQLWRKVRVDSEGSDGVLDAAATRFGATAATRNLHPIAELPAEPCTEQMGVAGPWHDRLPHFRMGFTPSSGDELQSELFVAAADAPAAMRVLRGLGQHLAPVLKISEVRTVAADGLWLSPSYHQDCVAFHFTWIPSWAQVQPVLADLESALAPFAARPHWGKLTTIGSRDLHSRYERLAAFGELLDEWDPSRKFRNAFLDAVLG
ncbi:MAG TPA: FAD-binding protein [Ilumatobacteraceae bacterium]|nr:FAD-binding protein [Ilumatobacteraceae bacterium]